MKNSFNKKMLFVVVAISFTTLTTFAKNNSGNNSQEKSQTKNQPKSSSKPNYSGSGQSYKYNDYTYGSSTSSSKSSSQPKSSGSSGGSGKSDYSSSKNNYNYSTPKPPSSNSSNYNSTPKQSSSPKSDYSQKTPDYKYNDYTYSKPKPTAPAVTSRPKESKPDYKYNDYTYSKPTSNPTSKPTPSAPKKSSTPDYSQKTPDYKYNDYTYSKPKVNIGKSSNNSSSQNNGNNSNNNNYNNGGYSNGSYNKPATNKNGTVLLKELKPGQSRIRADGTSDKVHKDGKGYTHSFVDGNGSVRKESIRYDKSGKEVKISDTERRQNGDVVTKYKSGVSEVRTKDGLRYQQDRYGKTVYQESKSSWNNRPVIYRQYNNNYTTVYVQNNYYGTPSYFYRPTYFDYNYYSYSLTSWGRPVYYNWHWNYNPWYNQYYRPYPSYYAPTYWLTDYLLMSLIQSNYDRIAADNEVMAQQSQYNQMALNDSIKEEIRVQVEQALRQQQQAVQSQSVMDPSQILTQGRLMVVHSDLNVEDQDGSQCQLDEGDVIRLLNQPSVQNPIVQLSVVSAKGTSCPIGTTLNLSATNLIEMESEFQARIQQGMNELKSGNVGTN